jgi:hypothetical protein
MAIEGELVRPVRTVASWANIAEMKMAFPNVFNQILDVRWVLVFWAGVATGLSSANTSCPCARPLGTPLVLEAMRGRKVLRQRFYVEPMEGVAVAEVANENGLCAVELLHG